MRWSKTLNQKKQAARVHARPHPAEIRQKHPAKYQSQAKVRHKLPAESIWQTFFRGFFFRQTSSSASFACR